MNSIILVLAGICVGVFGGFSKNFSRILKRTDLQKGRTKKLVINIFPT
jgi:hypothetical protein